jgi:DNA-binding NarL/FixJ family response regulator
MIVSETLRRCATAPPQSPVGEKALGRLGYCMGAFQDDQHPLWDWVRTVKAELTRANTEQSTLARQEVAASVEQADNCSCVPVQAFRFSPMQERVLALLSLGHTNKEIGAQLGLSDKTIKNHIYAMCNKIGVDNRVKLARYAWEREAHRA